MTICQYFLRSEIFIENTKLVVIFFKEGLMNSKSASFISEDFFLYSLCLQVSDAIKVTEQLLGLGHSTSCIDRNFLTFQRGRSKFFGHALKKNIITCLAVGFPPPWPALVSTLMSKGFACKHKKQCSLKSPNHYFKLTPNLNNPLQNLT